MTANTMGPSKEYAAFFAIIEQAIKDRTVNVMCPFDGPLTSSRSSGLPNRWRPSRAFRDTETLPKSPRIG